MDTSSVRLPFYEGSQQYDPVITRLRRMREKSATREEAATSGFWGDRSRVASRTGWWRGKMRWFVAGNHAAKIKANMRVEHSLGREQPTLWQPVDDQSASGSYRLNLMEEEHRIALKNAAEFEHMARISGAYQSLKAHSPSPYSLDPLMDAELEYIASLNGPKSTGEMKRITADGGAGAGAVPGGYDRDALKALVPAEEPVVKADKKPRIRNLRLLQIHNREFEIEKLAAEVLGEIKSICMDKPQSTKAALKVVERTHDVLTMPPPIVEETTAIPAMPASDAIFG